MSMLDTPDKVRVALPELIGVLEDCAKISNEMVQTLIKGPDSGQGIFDAHQRLYDAIQLLKGML